MAKKHQQVETEGQLLRDIQELTSLQFVYEDGWCGMVPFHRKLTEIQHGPPVPFAELDWREQADVLRSFIHWDRYPERAWNAEYTIRKNIAAGKPPEEWLEGTALPESSRQPAEGKATPPELKDHGNSQDLASRTAEATTDSERKLVWMETIRRLDAAYTAGGADALAKMNGIEIHVLYAEKMAELEAVENRIAQHGDNEINQLHKQKLEQQTADMAAWMRVHCPEFRQMEQEGARKGLTETHQLGGEVSLSQLRAQKAPPAKESGRNRDREIER